MKNGPNAAQGRRAWAGLQILHAQGFIMIIFSCYGKPAGAPWALDLWYCRRGRRQVLRLTNALPPV
jgi:hypothetical protein